MTHKGITALSVFLSALSWTAQAQEPTPASVEQRLKKLILDTVVGTAKGLADDGKDLSVKLFVDPKTDEISAEVTDVMRRVRRQLEQERLPEEEHRSVRRLANDVRHRHAEKQCGDEDDEARDRTGHPDVEQHFPRREGLADLDDRAERAEEVRERYEIGQGRLYVVPARIEVMRELVRAEY